MEQVKLPFRADIVGSFLRPERLKKARKDFESGLLSPAALQQIEDEEIEKLTLEFYLKSGKDGKTFGSISTKHIVEELREKYGIRVDKRKFIDARPVGALGYTNMKVELYKGVVATIKIHLQEK